MKTHLSLDPTPSRFLPRALKVHVNIAKQMLFAFAQKNQDKVNVVYLLAGTQVVTFVRTENFRIFQY
jgi:hypothetical protein